MAFSVSPSASRLSVRTAGSADIELGNLSTIAPSGPKPQLAKTPAHTTPATSARASVASLTPPLDEVSTGRSVAICLAAFFVIFTTSGCLSAFGVYQEMYQEMSTKPDTPFTGASPAIIDLIGTVAASFQTIGAPIATAWTKRFSPRRVIFIGATLFFTASMLASYSQKVWHFLLSQGFLLGIGTCFSYLPAATVSPTWYSKRRGLAMGIILSGTGMGGVVWAPVIHVLNEKLGFRNTLRVAGSLTALLIGVGGVVLDWDPATKRRLAEEKARLQARPHSRIRALWEIPLVDWRIARSSKFTLQLTSSFFQASAYFTPLFFLSAYARTLNYSAQQGANFIAINNVSNALGKIAAGLLADRFGRINMLLATTVASTVVSLAFWLPSTLVSLPPAKGLFVTYAILSGATTGPYVSLFPTCIVELFGPQNFASINGLLYSSRGLGTLFGTPTAGALLRGTGHGTDPSAYLHMTIMVAAFLAAASVAAAWVRIEAKK